jgi:hypothetical protein
VFIDLQAASHVVPEPLFGREGTDVRYGLRRRKDRAAGENTTVPVAVPSVDVVEVEIVTRFPGEHRFVERQSLLGKYFRKDVQRLVPKVPGVDDCKRSTLFPAMLDLLE